MSLCRSITLAVCAALVIAGVPAISGAAVLAPARPPVVTPARALHTGVHARGRGRARGRRGHGHHGHRHIRAELSAAPGTVSLGHSAPFPGAPVRRPPRAHATLPHTSVKLHRSESRGGTPYALGQASLSLSLETGAGAMPVCRNEVISNPCAGTLRGRSPPRGMPSIALVLLGPARLAHLPCAPAVPHRDIRFASRDCPTSPLPHVASFRAPGGRPFPDASPFTPDRASEGRPAGSLPPSWRHVS